VRGHRACGCAELQARHGGRHGAPLEGGHQGSSGDNGRLLWPRAGLRGRRAALLRQMVEAPHQLAEQPAVGLLGLHVGQQRIQQGLVLQGLHACGRGAERHA
jgi:hypothetical protein